MSELTYEGFKEFVMEQEPGRGINHQSSRTCAIGEYVQKAMGIDASDADRVIGAALGFDSQEFVPRLGMSIKYKTYGDLQAAMQEAA